jgi:integrase/recombinase XerC
MDDQRALLEAIARAVGVTPSDSTVRQITVGELYMLYKATKQRGRHWQMERNLLRPFVVAFWRKPVSSLTAESWDEHRARRSKSKTRRGKPPRDITLNQELMRAKCMLNWGVDTKRIGANPIARARPVKTRRRRESWFTAEQAQKLIDHAHTLRWDHQQRTFRAIVTVMFDTGLRISEALSLRWDRITLRGTTTVMGKGAKTRIVGFTHRALEAMNSLGRHPDNPHVFVRWKTGKRWSGRAVRLWFADVIDAAGLHHVKVDGDIALVPHLLRHSFASAAEERGATPDLIRTAMGHEKLATTQLYLHKHQQDAAEKMAAIMAPPRKPPRRSTKKVLQTSNEKLTDKRDRFIS